MANVLNLGGSGANVQSKTVKSSQTTQTITPEEGVDGFNPITVNPFVIQSKTVSPSTSQQVVKPDTGKDGLSQVTVNAIKLQSKSVTPSTSAQTVRPDSSYNGLSAVTVAGDANLIPSNILSGKSIFGVSGTVKPLKTAYLKGQSTSNESITLTMYADQAYSVPISVTLSKLIQCYIQLETQTVQSFYVQNIDKSYSSWILSVAETMTSYLIGSSPKVSLQGSSFTFSKTADQFYFGGTYTGILVYQ